MTQQLAIDGGTPVHEGGILDYRRGAQIIGEEEKAAVLEVLESKSLFRYYGFDLRHKVEGFEAATAELLGVPHALAVSSGTAALRAGLAALGIGPGDEVIVPAITFIASANAVVTSGAVPIFCDVDASLGLDPVALEACITERTAAIMPVHLENVVCDMDGVMAVARKHGIPVIEDACQAIGATYHGQQAGTIGEIGAFSLQLEKNITAGEGGLVVTRDPDLHLIAARYTDQGGQFVTAKGGTRGADVDEPFVGENLRMTEIGGAVAGVQLAKLPGIIASMQRAKTRILDGIGTIEGMQPRWVPDPSGDGSSSILWYVPSSELAYKFALSLICEGIPSARLYDGLPVYSHRSLLERRTVTPKRSPWAVHPVDVSYSMGMCPAAEDFAARAVIVAVGAEYTDQECDEVIEAVTKVAGALL